MNDTTSTSVRTHVDIYNRDACAELAARLGVTEDRLRRAVRMVGTRISSIQGYLRA